jgi:hypothetical protein
LATAHSKSRQRIRKGVVGGGPRTHSTCPQSSRGSVPGKKDARRIRHGGRPSNLPSGEKAHVGTNPDVPGSLAIRVKFGFVLMAICTETSTPARCRSWPDVHPT